MENKKEILSKCEELYQKHNEYVSLLSSVEVMSDYKLYNYYNKQSQKLEEISRCFEQYKQNINNNLNSNEIVSKLQQLYIDLDNGNIEVVKIEISTNDDYLRKIILNCFINYSIHHNFNYQTEQDKIEIGGNNVYKHLENYSGEYKQIKNNVSTTAKVFILKQPTKIVIDENDLKIETLKSSGAGGQHINKTESAVKITHVPTKISVKCQENRSQLQNKENAILLLKEKIEKKNSMLLKAEEEKQRKLIKNKIKNSKPIIEFNFDDNIIFNNLIEKIQNIDNSNISFD